MEIDINIPIKSLFALELSFKYRLRYGATKLPNPLIVCAISRIYILRGRPENSFRRNLLIILFTFNKIIYSVKYSC